MSTDGPVSSKSATDAQAQLPLPETALLKGLLRSLARIMANAQSLDGLRNLIDSALPLTIKNVMARRHLFGPQVYALAINIMTTFVHNEPTSLSVVQEQGLPEVFYASVEEEVEVSYDVCLTAYLF